MTCRSGVSTLRGLSDREGEFLHEEDLSTQSSAPEKDARVPREDEDPGGAERAQTAARERAQATHRLARRVARRSARALSLPRYERLRGAAEFQALFQRGQREERPSFVALWSERSDGRKVGFAVSRRVGGAVARNRARRRIREAYRRIQRALPPGVEVVFIGRPAAAIHPFADVLRDMRLTIEVVARSAHRRGSAETGP